MKIAFFDAKPYDIEIFDKINKDYNYNFTIKYYEYKLNPDTAVLAKGHEAVCAFVNDDLSEKTINVLYDKGVKLIALRCAGYNNVDLKAAYRKIDIVRVPAYSPYAVAEYTAALMLSVNRKIHRAYKRTTDNNFSINGLMGFDLYGKTVGIIGVGKIGQVFAEICKGFGMKILAYDPYPNYTLGINYVSLDELYRESDIISLHCPLNEETQHLISSESISKMKDGVVIINTSRGGLIDADALIDHLKTNKVSGAGLDVYEEESEYFFEDKSNENLIDDILARLLTFKSVLVTSHQGFFTKEAMENITRVTLDSIKAFEKGQRLENEIYYKQTEMAMV